MLRCFLAVLLLLASVPALFAGTKPAADFNGDGKSDLLWRNNSNGAVYVMPMSGATVLPGAVVYTEANPAWQIVAVADFDGDGKADILWWNRSTGQVYQLLMNGTIIKSQSLIYTEPDTDWKIVGTGDFNGDGKADLLWRNTRTGVVYLMPINGTGVQSGSVIWTEPNPAWQIVAVADFDGDGKSDILWWNSSTGQVYQMLMNGLAIRSASMIFTEANQDWQIVGTGDFDGDGRADLLWRNAQTGAVYLMPVIGANVQFGSFIWTEPDSAWQIVAIGDFDGDGKADIVWLNSSTGQVFQMLMNGFAVKAAGSIYTEPNTAWGLQFTGAQPQVKAPAITTQPASVAVTAGQVATFSVTATGTGPLWYQWSRNGTDLPGATSATYATAASSTADNGALFRVTVSNWAGTLASNQAVLTVLVTTLDASALTPTDWAGLSMSGSITGVTVSSASGRPVVNFKVTDQNGNPLKGFGSWTSKNPVTALYASYPNFGFSIAKLVPEDATTHSPSKWVNYCVTSIPNVANANVLPGKPSTDAVGTLVDNGDGSYSYTFFRDITKTASILAGTFTPALALPNDVKDLGDTTFDPTRTHRVSIQISGSLRGTGTNTADASTSPVAAVPLAKPINVLYDFMPSTGKAVTGTDTSRNIVTMAACTACHTSIPACGGGSRVDTRYCATCHTDQRKYGAAEATTTSTGYSGTTTKINGAAVGNFNTLIHLAHRGDALKKTGYNYGGILLNTLHYPQNLKDCGVCHTGANGANWKNVPSRLGCGSCHDGVNFATGANHPGGPQVDDQNCLACHTPTGIAFLHTP